MTTFEEFKSSMIEKISQLLDENNNIKKKDFIASVGSFYNKLKKNIMKPSRKEIAITKIVEKWNKNHLTQLLNKIKIEKYQKKWDIKKNKIIKNKLKLISE